MIWHKSTRCDSNACVEVHFGDRIAVRDASGTVIRFDRSAWRSFVEQFKT